MSMVRSIEELTEVTDPSWPEIQEMASTSTNAVTIIPCEPENGQKALYRLQMTAHSTLGGIVLNCAAMTVDHGWIKVLGSGLPGLPDPATVAGFPSNPGDTPPVSPGLVVAVDVLGGQFAIDGGGLGVQPGQICYWAPDALSWQGLGCGHSAFIGWLLSGDRGTFYNLFRWPGWETETEQLGIAQGYSVVPFLWTKEYDVATASRAVVPLNELFGLSSEMTEKLGGQPPLPWPH